MLALLGGYEIWIVLAVALLVFGHRLPGMARALGSSVVEFRRGLGGDSTADRDRAVTTVDPSRDHVR